MTPRVAIVVGHQPRSPGVQLAGGETEHAFNTELADQLWQALAAVHVGSRVFNRIEHLGYTTGMWELCERLNEWEADLVLSLHSNGHTNASISGSEALHWPVDASEADRPEVQPSGNAGERTLARVIAAAYSTAIGLRNRGALAQSHSWNGPPRFHATKLWRGNPKPIPGGPELWILSRTTAPTVIGESHFMSNPDDHAKARASLESGVLAATLAQALITYLEAP